jgi:hypothetical protein
MSIDFFFMKINSNPVDLLSAILSPLMKNLSSEGFSRLFRIVAGKRMEFK